jgi:hypothetical protein
MHESGSVIFTRNMPLLERRSLYKTRGFEFQLLLLLWPLGCPFYYSSKGLTRTRTFGLIICVEINIKISMCGSDMHLIYTNPYFTGLMMV